LDLVSAAAAAAAAELSRLTGLTNTLIGSVIDVMMNV